MEGTRDEAHVRVQLHIDLTCVSTAWPDWGAVLCWWIAKRQSRWPQCWRSCPKWNRLASSASCFGSSACLQSLSSVLCRTAYGLESPQDRLSGTHAEGAGHPDKLTVHGWRWYYVGGTHCWLFWRRWLKSPLSTEVWHPSHICRDCIPVCWSIGLERRDTCRQRKWIFGQV